MSIKDKIANAKESNWITEGFSDAEVKAIVELAKISAKIERYRLEKGMTQKEFAEFMGVSQGMVSKWESREYNFTIASLVEICEKLGISLNVSLTKQYERTDYKIITWNKEMSEKKKINTDWLENIMNGEEIA